MARELGGVGASRSWKRPNIEKQKQVLQQEKRYLEALRAENDARRENVYNLNMHFKEHVNQILDEVFAQNSPKMKRDEPPKYLCCPITLDLMQDPVIASDSYTYERSAIERHIREGGKSPKRLHKAITMLSIASEYVIN